MGSFSIWHWLILAILAVLVVCAIWLFARAMIPRRVRTDGVAPVSGPSGFRGWLLLVAVGVCVSPVLTIVKLTKIEDGANDSFIQEFHLMFDGDLAIHVAVIAMEVCTIIAMVRQSRNFVSFYIWTLVCVFLLAPAEIVWMTAFISWHEGKPFLYFLQKMVKPDDIGRWISTAIAAGIWTLYVLRSRRVANTFVR